jgi:hypothetical protein
MSSGQAFRIGTRAQVWRGSADRTTGGLSKRHLFQDKYGNIKSIRASETAKKVNNLGDFKLQ